MDYRFENFLTTVIVSHWRAPPLFADPSPVIVSQTHPVYSRAWALKKTDEKLNDKKSCQLYSLNSQWLKKMRTVVCGLGLTSRTSVVFCFVYFIFFLRVTWGCSCLWYELSCWVGVLEKAIAANYALRTGCVKKKRLWMVKDFFLAFAAPFPVLPALLAFICLPFFQLIHKSSMLTWCVVWAADSGIQSTTLIQFMGKKTQKIRSHAI